MKRLIIAGWKRSTLISLLVLLQVFPTGCVVQQMEPVLDELSKNFQGSVDFTTDSPTTFALEGTQEHLGDFTANGEVTFTPGEADGSLVGDGVAVLENADGEKLVAVVTWNAGPQDADGNRESSIQFSWRDSVQFNDGTVVESTGKFADPANRPPGLVVIAIIAVLTSLLLPAVQK